MINKIKTTARLIITFDCKRNCSYCCNKYTKLIRQAKTVSNLDFLKGYKEVCITGGEPLLDLKRTLKIVRKIKEINPDIKVYMYTAWFKLGDNWSISFYCLLNLLTGIHYTLHKNCTNNDIYNFKTFEKAVRFYDNKSFRLYIHEKVKQKLEIDLGLWSKIEKKHWQGEQECELPSHEDLFLLKENYSD